MYKKCASCAFCYRIRRECDRDLRDHLEGCRVRGDVAEEAGLVAQRRQFAEMLSALNQHHDRSRRISPSALAERPCRVGASASPSASVRPRPAELEGIRAARKAARARAFELGAGPAQSIFEVDAALLGADSEKEGAAGNFKDGLGLHPMRDCEGFLKEGVRRFDLMRATPK